MSHATDATYSDDVRTAGEGGDSLSRYYQRVSRVLREFGRLDDAVCPGKVGKNSCYIYDGGSGPENAKGMGRPWALALDSDSMAEKVDWEQRRTIYATTNYVCEKRFQDSWQPYYPDFEGSVEFENGGNPQPDYSDIQAYTPFSDIDLDDSVKYDRPEGNIPTDTIEKGLDRWIGEFATLCGGRDAVFALDSVGGAYVLIAPSVTRPIGLYFAREERGELFEELSSRMDEWIEETEKRVHDAVDGLEGAFTPDPDVNHKNRSFKAPLSVHQEIRGVVTPIDVCNPTYRFTDYTDVSDGLVDDVAGMAESFAADYSHGQR